MRVVLANFDVSASAMTVLELKFLAEPGLPATHAVCFRKAIIALIA